MEGESWMMNDQYEYDDDDDDDYGDTTIWAQWPKYYDDDDHEVASGHDEDD